MRGVVGTGGRRAGDTSHLIAVRVDNESYRLLKALGASCAGGVSAVAGEFIRRGLKERIHGASAGASDGDQGSTATVPGSDAGNDGAAGGLQAR